MKTKLSQTLLVGLVAMSMALMPLAVYAQSNSSAASTIFSSVTTGALSNPITAPLGIAGKAAAAGVNLFSGSASSTGSVSCNGATDFWNYPTTCIARSMATFLGVALVWLASWVLELSGLLFNIAITNTVLQFGNVVSANVVTAINTAWSAFRDISNIVIIGMFTFIAIATILGNTTYGAKKMISRVLIVAILINFSLLFTKLVIDVSNFTAIQFLNAAANNTGNCTQCSNLNQTSGGTSATAVSQPNGSVASGGIAGAFLYYSGAQSIGQTYTAVSSISANPQNGGWYALLYGVLVAVLELVASLVLLYGAFLLITRAILMVFLMVTAAIAFATYLIPNLSSGGYGFNAWLQALLKNAVFAPLLAVLLWVTLTIAQGYNNTAGGSLGALAADPTQTANIGMLFGYVIVIGLLFASIRIAASFSAQIGGFNWAQSLLSTPLAAANRYIVAPGLRNLGGRAAAARSQALGKQIDAEATAQANIRSRGGTQDLSKLTNLIRQKEKSDTRAKGTFDLVNTKLGQTIAKTIGAPKALTTATKTNFSDSSKKTAEEAAKSAADAQVSKKAAQEEAEKQIKSEHDDRKDALEQQRDDNAAMLETLKKQVSEQKDKEGIEDKFKSAKEHLENERAAATQARVEIVEKFKGSTNTGERDKQLREQDDRIQKAQTGVTVINDRIKAIEKPFEERLEAAKAKLTESDKILTEHEKSYRPKLEKRTQEIMRAGVDNAKEVGANLTQNWLQRATNMPTDTVTAKKARSFVEKKIKVKGLQEKHAAEKEELHEAGVDDHGAGGVAGGAH